MSTPHDASEGASASNQTWGTSRESHVRSMLKAFSWRIVATTTTTLIAWWMTGEVGTALSIGSIEFFIKFFVYYAHERIWQLVPRGAVRKLLGRN